MDGSTLVNCLLHGICICVSYNYNEKDDVCFGPQPIYRDFATKTDYNIAVKPHLNETTVSIVVPDGCKPTLFYQFQRHTIRYPSVKNIKKALENLPEIQEKLQNKKSKICAEDIKRIASWQNTFPIEKGDAVSDSGKNATRLQVSRLRKRFPAVFGQARGPLENMIVDYSVKGTRTKDTAEAFLREWFGDHTFDEHIKNSNKFLNQTNPLNTFHETCEAIMKEHEIKVTSQNEAKLIASEVYKKFEKTIGARLGFDVKKNHIKAMLNYCQFEMAVYGSSPWCAIFSEDEFRFAELLDDAKDFDVDAYGTPRNEIMACPVAVDLFKHIRGLNETDWQLPRAVLHFSHAGAFKKISGLLNLAKASTITHDCADRSWFSTRQSPFNANLALVHYTCPSGQTNRVVVLFNEKIVHLSGCQQKLCTVGELENILRPKIDNCDFNKICSK